MQDKQIVKIKFDTLEKAEGFLSWLSDSGEQDYFEQVDYGHIKVAETIDYFQGGDRFGGPDGLTAVAE